MSSRQTPAPPASGPRPGAAATVLGVIAVVFAVLGWLAVIALIVLAMTVDPNYTWLLIPLIPVMFGIGVVALVLGVIGVVVGARAGARIVWPVIGLCLGVAALLAIGLLFLSFG